MKFTEEHEWLLEEDGVITVGITDHAAEQLGDIVFVELPEVGTEVSKDDEVVVIESVKAASDILAPIDGEIVEVNDAIVQNPAMVNEDPQGEAWFFRIRASDPSQMDGRPRLCLEGRTQRVQRAVLVNAESLEKEHDRPESLDFGVQVLRFLKQVCRMSDDR